MSLTESEILDGTYHMRNPLFTKIRAKESDDVLRERSPLCSVKNFFSQTVININDFDFIEISYSMLKNSLNIVFIILIYTILLCH